MNKIYAFICAFLFLMLFSNSYSYGQQEERKKEVREETGKKIRVNENEKRVEISAFLNIRYYRKPSTFAVVYSGGFTAKRALFIANVSPMELYEALKRIGSIPVFKTTQEKKEESELSNLNITFSWKGSEQEYRLEDIISNSQNKEFDFQFLGNIVNAEQIKSGELVCLDFCQSGITGVSTIEDKMYDKGKILFTVNQKILPSNGTDIKITFSVTTPVDSEHPPPNPLF